MEFIKDTLIILGILFLLTILTILGVFMFDFIYNYGM